MTTEANRRMQRMERSGRVEAGEKREHCETSPPVWRDRQSITQTARSVHFCQVQMFNENGTDGPGVV